MVKIKYGAFNEKSGREKKMQNKNNQEQEENNLRKIKKYINF